MTIVGNEGQPGQHKQGEYLMALRITLVLLILAGVAVFVSTAAVTRPPGHPDAATCQTSIDLMLVVDGSGSIFASDFTKMKNFSKDLVGNFDVSASGTHIGVVQFSGQGEGRLVIGLSSD